MRPGTPPGPKEKMLALILAGGQGTRLKNLTQNRAKPAVPFGGTHRIIDYTISNCVNSGLRRIGVLIQYQPDLLAGHVQNMADMLRKELDGDLELFAVAPRTGSYSGTADAVYRNLDMVRLYKPDYVIILAGDHVYKMDYRPMLAFHREKQADLTVGCIKVPLTGAGAFGVMGIDTQNRVTSFKEKPAHPQPIPGQPFLALASTGIYIFNTRFLVEQLTGNGDTAGDFGKNIIPAVLAGNHGLYAYPFVKQNGESLYWRDVGTVDAYWQASMDLLSPAPGLDINNEEWPLWTLRKAAGARPFVTIGADIRINHSLLFGNVRVNAGTHIRNSVVLPNVTIGKHCHIENAVIDEGACIPDDTVIGKNPPGDSRYFYVSEKGIVLVNEDMLQRKAAVSKQIAGNPHSQPLSRDSAPLHV